MCLISTQIMPANTRERELTCYKILFKSTTDGIRRGPFYCDFIYPAYLENCTVVNIERRDLLRTFDHVEVRGGYFHSIKSKEDAETYLHSWQLLTEFEGELWECRIPEHTEYFYNKYFLASREIKFIRIIERRE